MDGGRRFLCPRARPVGAVPSAGVMLSSLGRLSGALLLGALLVADAAAQAPVSLMPGVTSAHQVEFTPHGPVAFTVITAPPPTGLYTLGPVLAGTGITGGRATVSQIEQGVASTVSTAGVNGDFFSGPDGHPSGIVISSGADRSTPRRLRAPRSASTRAAPSISAGSRSPAPGRERASAGRLAGRQPEAEGEPVRPLHSGLGRRRHPSSRTLRRSSSSRFRPLNVNTDLTAPVALIVDGSSTPIPADGAVLVATGAAAEKLQAEAPADSPVTVRLILPPSWGTVVSALGGGPLLVRGGRAVFHTSENFRPSDLTARDARAAVGQLSDGRVILVAVDGGRPGYSVGMTTYELAQTMARLGAVNAAGLAFGKFVHGRIRRAAR